MKYLSLDIETTCLGPAKPENILMISMVVEDTSEPRPIEDLPHFTCFIDPGRIEGQAYALSLNGWILDFLSGRAKDPIYPIYRYQHWVTPALEFLTQHFGSDRINVAGKNAAGFDIPFLPKSISSRFRHRVIDPGSVFVDWSRECLPSLDDIAEQFGEHPVTHDALDDARHVIRTLRRSYPK